MTRTQGAAIGWDHAKLAHALRATGVTAGDTVYFQVCHEALGVPNQGDAARAACEELYRGLREVVGDAGTIVVPTYTFSFCHQQVYDPAATPTRVGPWNTFTAFPEHMRALDGAVRSVDPIFSNAGIGPRAADLLLQIPRECLGNDSVHARMRRVGGRICILGVGLYEAIFRHYVESVCRVPWRFDKVFAGIIRENGRERREQWLYNVRILVSNGDPAGEALEALARSSGVCRAAAVGPAELVTVEAERYYELAAGELKRNPWSTARGPAGDPLLLEEHRVGGPVPAASMAREPSMMQMIDTLSRLPRDVVSHDSDAALRALAGAVPMTTHGYRTGTHAGNRIVPEKWTCTDAWLATLDGRRALSRDDHPLHVMSYSLPFDGTVTRRELDDHLHVHPRLANAIPHASRVDDRDWGLCCSRTQRDALADERYRVVIRSTFSYAALQVGEIVVPGESDECVLLAAYLGHPCQANIGLSGVAVALDVARALQRRRAGHLTYRILIAPEAIGLVAYLAANDALIPRMRAALVLGMLGSGQPHALARLPELSALQRADLVRAFTACGGDAVYQAPELVGNDAGDVAALGARIPLAALVRTLPPGDPEFPYREHRSSEDTSALVQSVSLEQSRDLVLAMLDAMDARRR